MENLKEINVLYSGLKGSAKKRGINFELTKVDLWDLDIPITCPVLGIPLKFERGKATDNSVSIDRIDSTKGYTADNIIIISNRANTLKRDATLKELQQLAEFYTNL